MMNPVHSNLTIGQSPQSTTSGTITIEVGGKNFKFAASTFTQPYIKDSVFEVYATSIANNAWKWESQAPPFYDCDPKIFEHIANYIRFGTVPKWKEVENPKVVLAAAKFFLLKRFSENFQESKYKIAVNFRFGQTSIRLKLHSKDTTQTIITSLYEKKFLSTDPSVYRLKKDPSISSKDIEKLMPLTLRFKDQGIKDNDTLFVCYRHVDTTKNSNSDNEWVFQGQAPDA